MNITLKQLSVFATTARLRGITKAAQALSMTQSAASQSLKELENILGHPLFTRFGRKLVINDHGQALLSKATQMLALQAQMQQQGGIIKHSMDLARQEAIKQAVKANLGLGVLSVLSIQQELSLGLFKILATPLNLNRQLSSHDNLGCFDKVIFSRRQTL
jgi:DNA-binding transcriptional LysR family regulator